MPGNMMNKQLAFGIPMVHKDASGKQVKDVSPKWIHQIIVALLSNQ